MIFSLGRRHRLEENFVDAVLERENVNFAELVVGSFPECPGEVARVADGQTRRVEEEPPQDVRHRSNLSWLFGGSNALVVEPEEVPPVPRTQIDLKTGKLSFLTISLTSLFFSF